MGLNEGTNATYLGISDGRISLRVKEDTPGAVQIVNRETGKVSWVKYYKSMTGYLAGIENRQDRFNEKAYNWHLTIIDEGDTFILQIRESSGYGRSLMKTLPNVDFTKKITFAPYVKTVEDKKRGTLYLSQDGNNVEWYFTQEHPNGMPELRQRTDARGNVTYDDSEVTNFFLNYVEKVIQPRIAEANRIRLGEVPAGETSTDNDDTSWMDENLPGRRSDEIESKDIYGAMMPTGTQKPAVQTFADGTPIVEDDLPF